MHRRSEPLLVLLLVVCFVCRYAPAKVVRFTAQDPLQRDLIQFSSEGAYEKVVGLSHSIQGWIELDPNDLRFGLKGQLDADLRSFETGDAIWTDFIRDKVLTTSEFPSATFLITQFLSASKSRLSDKEAVTVKVSGTLTMRGISKPQSCLLRVTYNKQSDKTSQRMAGNLVRVSSNFDLDLGQYDVKIPDPLKSKLARVVQLSLDVVGSDGTPPSIIPANEPPKKQD
jgi:polyisoprenoid-binding protein YceI